MNTTLRTHPALFPLFWVLASLSLNGLIFALGWNDSTTLPLKPSWAPPGWLVGTLWVVLFVFMGLAHGRLYAAKSAASTWVMALLLSCLVYPLYTVGLQNGIVGWWGNLFTLILALVVLWQTRADTTNSWLILPVVLWLAFALCLTTSTLHINTISF